MLGGELVWRKGDVVRSPHLSPKSQVDFRCLKFKPKIDSQKKKKKIKVNICYIYGELSKLEEMREENVDNLYQNKNFII